MNIWRARYADDIKQYLLYSGVKKHAFPFCCVFYKRNELQTKYLRLKII